ncbi:MAG: alpha/beta hydrolase [Ktedonobacterales bacterium]
MPTTTHLVDPALVPMLNQLPQVSFSAETLPLIRTERLATQAQAAANAPAFPDIMVTQCMVPGPAGAPDVRVLVYEPTSAPRPLHALVWIHGGGYVIGSAEGDDLNLKSIVRAVGCAAVSVDYRLAPETPYPGPIEDCYAALKWLTTEAEALGVDTSRIAIGGVSAGGGLAAALALLARDRGELPVAFQLLIFPMLDDRTAATSDPHPYTGEFVWTPDANYFGWSALLGQPPGGEGIPLYAAAARAEHLEGLPPAYISVGSLDLFLEEDVEYARRLLRAGVPTELHVYPGAYHAYQWTPDAWMSQAEAQNRIEALRRALRPHISQGS